MAHLLKKNHVDKHKLELSSDGKPVHVSFRLFERCSGGVLNLRFDSKILEEYYSQCSFPHALFRFRGAVAFFAFICTIWMIFFSITRTEFWGFYVSGSIIGIIVCVILYGLTFVNKILSNSFIWLCVMASMTFSLLFLLPFVLPKSEVSAAFNLSLILQLLMIIYTTIPFRLWQVISICGPVSIIHILLASFTKELLNLRVACVYILIHCCIHLVGIVQHLLSQIRRRSTFMHLGHGALMRKALEKEQHMRDDMIQSLMPKQVADLVMRGIGKNSGNDASEDSTSETLNSLNVKNKKSKKKTKNTEMKLNSMSSDEQKSKMRNNSFSDDDYENETRIEPRRSTLKTLDSDDGSDSSSRSISINKLPAKAVHFRKFHVSQMENVSILFADIVGFTNMSSNKSASLLVYLLNDLFARFDTLCERTQCEKIATLGDCYYCVSGCPDAVANHAERIVEMGRAMCLAIQQFDEDHNEQVNMRVGVHTGKVICGLVGTRRFKFDVWSNDVTLANKMESSGAAGKVHISEATLEFVKDIYKVNNGEPVPDIRKVKVLVEFFNKEEQSYAIKHTQDEALIKTYFIEKRFDDRPVVTLERMKEISPPDVSISEVKGVESKTSSTEASILPSSATGEVESKPRGSDADILDALAQLSKPEKVFEFPPISPFSLSFTSKKLENAYKKFALRLPKRSFLLTLATPRLSPVINGLAHLVFLIALLTMSFLNLPNLTQLEMTFKLPCIFGLVAVFLNTAFLILVFTDLLAWAKKSASGKYHLKPWKRKVFFVHHFMFHWSIRNVYGSLLLCSPSAFILANFNLCMFYINPTIISDSDQIFTSNFVVIYGLIISVMLFSFTLFPNYSSWTKSLSAAVISIISIVLLHWPFITEMNPAVNCSEIFVSPATVGSVSTMHPILHRKSLFPWEMTVIMLLNLVLIWTLNREIDISFRLSFNRDFETSCARKAIWEEKRQGEWLLENIIPPYVLTDLRKTNKYSQHIKDAGVMFASIANFSEFYDEQYLGGQEMLRVLNEIFADFEHGLESSKFKDVEKIKTIAECFMAASGLNVIQRNQNRRPDAHLYALMDFCIELIRTLDEFNRQMFNFKFELKIGYNIGEVTAGVIGTTKLLYDIWGDTVNVASRMYSTGQKARIQVTEDVSKRLSPRYEFEYRGNVFVKGKGEMRTYLLVGRKSYTHDSKSIE